MMKIGASLIAQNYTDWDRYLEVESSGEHDGTPPKVSDAQVLQEQFRLGRLIEPLGYDSIWTVEHHYTPYTMINNPLQFLSYFAGCTNRVDLGTMVIVLPWHDPVRVAEEIIGLDHMLNGRKLKVGFGRGLGDREFNGFEVDMAESRERFLESLDIIRTAFSGEWFSYDGKFRKIPRTSLRPEPRSREDLLSNLYGAWGSPSSMPIVAKEGLRPLFVPSRSWDDYEGELVEFNRIRQEHGWDTVRSTAAAWVYCAETEEQAADGAAAYLPEYTDSTNLHYRFSGEHLKGLESYSYYVGLGERMKQLEASGQSLAGLLGNQIYGTPADCIEKIRDLHRRLNVEEFIAVFSYGSMPVDVAEANMRLFATEVIPELRDLP